MTCHTDALLLSFLLQRGIMTSTARLHEVVWCENNKNPVAEIAKHTGEESGESNIKTHGHVLEPKLESVFISERETLCPGFCSSQTCSGSSLTY